MGIYRFKLVFLSNGALQYFLKPWLSHDNNFMLTVLRYFYYNEFDYISGFLTQRAGIVNFDTGFKGYIICLNLLIRADRRYFMINMAELFR